MRTKLAIVAAVVLSMVLAVASHLVVAQSMPRSNDDQARIGTGERQPRMQEALNNLQQAEQDLEAGSHDKGGHRVKALALVKEAQREVQAGIEWDRQHPSGRERDRDRDRD